MAEEFTKKTIKKFGARGSPVYEQAEQTTDLDDLSERIEETAVPFCTCGRVLATLTEVARCSVCELLCCGACRISISKMVHCPTCARQRFDLDKRLFLALVFLEHGQLAPDDLVQVTTHEGEVLDITIDPATGPVLDHGYLTEEGGLSATGREAVAVGKAVYGDDPDVQGVLDQLRLAAVVDQP